MSFRTQTVLVTRKRGDLPFRAPKFRIPAYCMPPVMIKIILKTTSLLYCFTDCYPADTHKPKCTVPHYHCLTGNSRLNSGIFPQFQAADRILHSAPHLSAHRYAAAVLSVPVKMIPCGIIPAGLKISLTQCKTGTGRSRYGLCHGCCPASCQQHYCN